MIFEGSRYATVPLTIVEDSDGTSHPTLLAGTPTRVVGSFTYATTTFNDRLDLIAWKLWGDPNLWWMLADKNPDTLFYPDNLTPGTLLRVPK